MKKLGFLAATMLLAAGAHASQTQVHAVEGYKELAGGDLDGAALGGDGTLRQGPATTSWADGLPGPVTAVVRHADGHVYAATATPGRVWRVAKGQKPVAVLAVDKPLVTALLPLGDKLVALTAPEGGAHVLDPKSSAEPPLIPAPGVRMILGGAVLDGVVYAVGGGDEGVLLKLSPGGKQLEKIATVKEATLRSVAAAKTASGPKIVVGGGDEGVVYALEAGKLRALVDAAPGEATSLAIDAQGAVYAALVDGEGKLSKAATARDKDDGEEGDKKKKPKPRKVKSAEVLRIDPKGGATVLWQSKDHGAYALALVDGGKRLLVGTGPMGRVYEVDPTGRRPAGILARSDAHDEITAIAVDKTGAVLLGAAHGGGVLSLASGPGTVGTYLSPTLDAGALARYGTVSVRRGPAAGGQVKISLRTGNTSEPDDTWSPFSTPISSDGVLNAPPGQYAQVRVDLSGGAEVQGLSLAYLVDNRPPELDRVEVLAPGWKVIATPRDPPEQRSVTFNEKPFSKFLDRKGAMNPTLDERPFGKQSFEVGWRTVYAWVEDPDGDALRYRFSIGKVDAGGKVSSWKTLKDWSEEPFASFEAARFGDGDYKVRVETDDLLTNGPARAATDQGESPTFTVSHAAPKVTSASAARAKDRVGVKMLVEGALPLSSVRCSVGGGEWIPLDPSDGLLDQRAERFDVGLPATGDAGSVACEVWDVGLNSSRVDLAVR